MTYCTVSWISSTCPSSACDYSRLGLTVRLNCHRSITRCQSIRLLVIISCRKVSISHRRFDRTWWIVALNYRPSSVNILNFFKSRKKEKKKKKNQQKERWRRKRWKGKKVLWFCRAFIFLLFQRVKEKRTLAIEMGKALRRRRWLTTPTRQSSCSSCRTAQVWARQSRWLVTYGVSLADTENVVGRRSVVDVALVQGRRRKEEAFPVCRPPLFGRLSFYF